MPRTLKKIKPTYDQIACCFQGGGALGAYQVGVLRALDEAGYYPDWFTGTSIGAINAAIAAGNPKNIRVEKMCQFWEKIATPTFINNSLFANDFSTRQIQHLLSAQSSLLFGQPGFFVPRIPPVIPGYDTTPDKLSYYDINPLKNSLEEFIDFDRINSGSTRLSLGAIEICSGEIEYFDSLKQKIGPEHIMASGALPPSFPAVEIEGKYYWDGGISSNSPASYVLSKGNCSQKLLCFAIHLFDSYGLQPRTLNDVNMRKKDITYSSRFSKTIHLYQEIHELKNSIHILSQFVPPEEKENPEIKLCICKGRESAIALVRFLYEQDESECESKDYEFSSKSISERIEKGYCDGLRAVKTSPWLSPVSPTTGIALYDMSPYQHLKTT
ncbi:patatin-like phospholipase family protein [Legionella sp.]|uniref:patatin-like phospholipase family protein n=1 Tax=Legionella sp. TaxID=459 RepID=UPI003CB8DD69